MTRPRDSQRARLYAAERAAKMDDESSMTLAQCQHYVIQVTGSAWFQARWGRRSIGVSFNSGGGRAYPDRGLITLGPAARHRWIVLHELAHLVQPYETAWHGPEFRSVFLALVRHELGAEAAERLRQQFVAHKLKYKAAAVPKPRPDKVVTQVKEKVIRQREAARPVSRYDRQDAARLIRRLAAQGHFGPAGRKPRIHALATARALESQ